MNISIDNTHELEAALHAIGGKALLYMHTAGQIANEAREALARVQKFLPEGSLVGTRVRLSSRPQLPAAYGNHNVIHTEVIVEVFPTGLAVTELKRFNEPARSTPSYRARVLLPQPLADYLKDQLYHKVITLY